MKSKDKRLESKLYQKWTPILEMDGGIADEHTAYTTAVLLENYETYLKENPKLIAEDQVSTGSLKGINLAILGLLRRSVTDFIGMEFVGVQAMPTPRSPVHRQVWSYDDNKGTTSKGDEFHTSPFNHPLGHDPYYSSNVVQEAALPIAADGDLVFTLEWAKTGNTDPKLNITNEPVVIPQSVYAEVYDANGNVLDAVYFTGDYYDPATGAPLAAVAYTTVAGQTGAWIPGAAIDATNFNNSSGVKTVTVSVDQDGGVATPAVSAKVFYEVSFEASENTPEVSFRIEETNIDLIKRQLRGRFTLDSAYDANKLHGLDLDAEMMNQMKWEVLNGMNREIIDDLRTMAYTVKEVDFGQANLATLNVTGNYDDLYRLTLDAIQATAAEIANVGRMGMGNFLIGNPITLSFLSRTNGFVGSGASYDGGNISFAGTIGGKIKVYHDPQYPVNELLIGFKGSSQLETGYIHAPYLPLTATPTMHNQLTGDPIKIFYTRYGKTFRRHGGVGGGIRQAIEYGDRQYARLKLTNFPNIFV